MNEKYIKHTHNAVDLLCTIYAEDTDKITVIKEAQAEGRTEDLIKELRVIRELTQNIINHLLELQYYGLEE